MSSDFSQTLPISQLNVRMTSPDGTPPPDMPAWAKEFDQPYLHGSFAPTNVEYLTEELEIEGICPRTFVALT